MNKTHIGLIAVLLLLFIASSALFVVKETERAVKLEFGEVVEADIQPGLHWRIPIMHQIRKFDSRILTMDASPVRFLTLDKKSLIIDSFAKWRIVDVEKYYTATNGEEARTYALLAQRINDGLRNEVGVRDMHEVVSGRRDELMEQLTSKLNEVALRELGVEVVDIRVKQVDLPKDVRQSVYERMKTERQQEAREHRARGKELAEGIRASADREKIIIEAEAYRQAEMIRGDGDAQATAIYAKAYEKDAEFYAFWRSLNAYEQTFSSKSDILLLKPDSDFFRYLNESKVRK